jgi:uncharacterized membrane protein
MADQIQLASLGVMQAKIGRLAYIDWMRGLACVVMFQAHCYNSWLSPESKKSGLYLWSQLAATLPAPLFIFLAGISIALVTQRMRQKGQRRGVIAKKTISRGAEIFGLGLLFRVQEFALGYRWSPWTDLLRVDVLNILGLSMMLMGFLCWATDWQGPDWRRLAPSSSEDLARASHNAILWGLLAAALVALATPLVWTTYRPSWLPWPLESYFNGVHIYNQPQPWLFPLFPWSAFGFIGLAVGFFLFSEFGKKRETLAIVSLGGAGALACTLAFLFDSAPLRLYRQAIYDYWHTSPNFFLMRCGILLLVLLLVYAWCRWGLAQKGFSPMIQLGNTSLLVYWVHIEFVYGRFSILPKGQCGIPKATAGLLAITLAMLVLSVLRTRWKKQPARALPGSARAAATAES